MIRLSLPYPPSSNNLFPSGRSGRRFISSEYRVWRELAGIELKQQNPGSLRGPVRVVYEFGRVDKRRRDLSNLEKAIGDLLVAHGVIEDDSLIEEMTLRWVYGVGKRAFVEVRAA